MLNIYTDGSCLGNPGPGGWGVFIKHIPSSQSWEITGTEAMTTNNRMELQAAIEALKWLSTKQEYQNVTVHTDSNYVKQGITQWISSWKNKGWLNSQRQPVKNKDLWLELDSLNKQVKINWQWIKAHDGHSANEHVDRLAYQSAVLASGSSKG